MEADNMRDNPIRVSFSKDEEQLLKYILNECKYIGKAKWMKIAAREKLQRDKSLPNIISTPTVQSNIPDNVINATPKQNNKLPIIGELTELFQSGR
jgi:hypothetical protein